MRNSLWVTRYQIVEVEQLKKTNSRRTARGGNANAMIFALNRLPVNFVTNRQKQTQGEELDNIKRLATISDAMFDAVAVIMMNQYPEKLDQLIEKGPSGLTQKDYLSIQLWAEEVNVQLLQLESELKNKGELETYVQGVRNQITELQNNLELIRGKLQLFEEEENEDERMHKVSEVNKERGEYSLDFIDDGGDNFFIWPVSPSGGITAYYHDDSYKDRFKVVHNAIDIRQRQGSPIFAPANGYVYKAKDNGMGYSYMILAHKDGLMTVYGHLTEFMAEEGDLRAIQFIVERLEGKPFQTNNIIMNDPDEVRIIG